MPGRNRQPRRDARGTDNARRSAPSQHSSTVPGTKQVVRGASVSIVLKQDQATGREVQGVIQDVLTSGNHHRGIKVRLTDGQVGRVQRMVNADTLSSSSARNTSYTTQASTGTDNLLPPPRTLADYIPDDPNFSATTDGSSFQTKTPTAICPICHSFEGDEIAVSRHVEDHL